MGMLSRLFDRLLGLPEATTPDLEIARDLRVPMPDGVVLRADRYRPRGSEPLPVVLIRTPYGKHKLDARGTARVLARRGMQVVVQDARGTFGSEGRFSAFHQEKEDGLATAAWLREQPWCDGRLAMAGASYLGFTQWAVGPYLDPPLEAMCLGVTSSEFRTTFYPGGVFALHNLLTWAALIGTQEEAPLGGLLPDPRRESRLRRAMAHVPIGRSDVAAIGKRVPFLREAAAHAGAGDTFWADVDNSAAAVKMTTPTSMVTGWWDLLLPAQLRDYAALREAGRRSRILIGPWAHDLGALRALLSEEVSWLSAHLLGDTAQLQRSPVRLYLQRAGRWLDFEQWPPPQSAPTPLHLLPYGRLGWSAPGESAPDVFTYDPARPTRSVGGPLLDMRESRQRDNRAIEARPDVLVYTGAPLPRPLDLIGPVSATVHVRTDTGHADVFVRLCDVDPAGVSRNVTDGILRLPAGSEGVIEAEVELHPTGYRFLRGHRLRVQVAGGAFPRFARNHGTGEPVGEAVRTRPTRFEIFHDAVRPSALMLPVFEGR
ncbi:putative CocE/NonD family hydrolase [Nonomuraea thailandensis]|uniref:CocE/NonD family hydrolase n=1 Tax=Nonomuraea thailandensis TaxID=1188745 RepID=A0A9X2K963_9ACTN|nr:CocE/NonD family hydrolase [Nonomuraea thailandensis]MCP2361496.1 putative CocE/NonD family hydrolase [Nonomuraea thailandensis]